MVTGAAHRKAGKLGEPEKMKRSGPKRWKRRYFGTSITAHGLSGNLPWAGDGRAALNVRVIWHLLDIAEAPAFMPGHLARQSAPAVRPYWKKSSVDQITPVRRLAERGFTDRIRRALRGYVVDPFAQGGL